ncbi:7 transmembrane receptor [Oesophagostomum dentatum]|uniref:7 transmembrane receptor n=1 Tax=Oesophagostomum dentatum TaxID=61180 RepID=A0A0B1SZJ1_OESDE|nr:7 transmembrane receptor [Oesophagostomum dentatum]
MNSRRPADSTYNIRYQNNRTKIDRYLQQSIDIVWWSNVVCLPIITMVGLTCNLLNIAILTSNKGAKRIPSWTLLLALAVCDCLFLVFAMFEVTPVTIPALAFSQLFNAVYSHVSLYIRVLASTFYKSSVLIVVAFNVERYICVVHPFSCHRICTGRTSRLAIGACLVISLLCSIQWPICYEVRYCYDHITQEFLYVILLSENETLRFYYRLMDYVSLIAFNILPIVSLLVMNCMIIATLRRVVAEDAKKEEESTRLADGTLVPESSSHRLNPNALLFAVVLMLLICVGPQAPARLLFDLYGQYHPKAIVYTCVSQQLVFLNAALNFALYCLVSKRYRILMRQTIKRLLRSFKAVDRPLKMSARQSKSSTAPATSMEENHSRNLVLVHAV